jgi:hypothetical protein
MLILIDDARSIRRRRRRRRFNVGQVLGLNVPSVRAGGSLRTSTPPISENDVP